METKSNEQDQAFAHSLSKIPAAEKTKFHSSRAHFIQVRRHYGNLCLSVQRMALHEAHVTWSGSKMVSHRTIPSFFRRLKPLSDTNWRIHTHLDEQVSSKHVIFYQYWVSIQPKVRKNDPRTLCGPQIERPLAPEPPKRQKSTATRFVQHCLWRSSCHSLPHPPIPIPMCQRWVWCIAAETKKRRHCEK